MIHPRHRTAAFVLAATIAAGLPAAADPINVPNAGFEDRLTFESLETQFGDGTDKYNKWSQEAWRHWEVDNNGGPLRIWNPGQPGVHETTQGALDVGFGGNAPEGELVVVVRSRYNDDEFHDPPQVRDFEAAVQILEETFDPAQSYTLTVQVGRLPGSVNYSPQWFGYAVQLAVGGTNVSGATFQGRVDGGTVIAEDLNTLEVGVDEFVTATVAYAPDPAHADLAGQPLQIRLCALEDPADHALTGWAAFDDVQLQTGFFPGAPPRRFEITAIDYAAGDNMVTLTWTSKPGESYGVYWSTDLTDWSADINDSVPAADPGETTSATFDLGDFGIADLTDLFFRVEKN